MNQQSQASTSRQPMQKIPVELTTDLLGRFKPSKVFNDALERPSQSVTASSSQHGTNSLPQITSLDFDDTGEKCLTTGEDEGFVVWDMRKGKKLKQFWSKKYGVNLGRFTHRAGNIVHASTKAVDSRTTLEDQHALRYHSTHDNKYLSYFKGHTARVRSLTMNPSDDTFLSAGDDATVRLWDLRMPECKGLLKDMGGSTIATFDNTGSVFAVACSETQTLALYACQNMDTEPFGHTALIDPALEEVSSPPPRITVTSLQFSNNGIYILVGTSSDVHYLYDAYDLHPIRRLTGHRPLAKASGEELSFTADSRFVLSGSVEGAIYFWDLGKDKLDAAPKDARGGSMAAKTLKADVVIQPSGLGVTGPSRAVKFNPRLCVMAVGGEELSFWLPAPDEEAKIEEGW